MIRTFIAVELPERFIPEIKKIESEFNIQGIKLVEPELVHITLKFLGDINESNVEPIAFALSGVDCKPFEAKVTGVGIFPKPAYIKVIWLGAEGNFETLHNEVERLLQPFNFEKDHKFLPHATLARVKQLREKSLLLEKIRKLEHIELGSMMVEKISLKKSTLRPQGPIYETLKDILLK